MPAPARFVQQSTRAYSIHPSAVCGRGTRNKPRPLLRAFWLRASAFWLRASGFSPRCGVAVARVANLERCAAWCGVFNARRRPRARARQPSANPASPPRPRCILKKCRQSTRQPSPPLRRLSGPVPAAACAAWRRSSRRARPILARPPRHRRRRRRARSRWSTSAGTRAQWRPSWPPLSRRPASVRRGGRSLQLQSLWIVPTAAVSCALQGSLHCAARCL